MFFCEIPKIFKNTFFCRTPPVVASEVFCKDFVDINCDSFISQTRRLYMAAGHLFLNYNCILVFAISFSDRWGHSKLTTLERYLKILFCVIFVAQTSDYGKCMALHKLILIFLQFTNRIN